MEEMSRAAGFKMVADYPHINVSGCDWLEMDAGCHGKGHVVGTGRKGISPVSWSLLCLSREIYRDLPCLLDWPEGQSTGITMALAGRRTTNIHRSGRLYKINVLSQCFTQFFAAKAIA